MPIDYFAWNSKCILNQQSSSSSNNTSWYLITVLETPQGSLPKRDPVQQQIPSFSFSAAVATIAANLRSSGHSANAHIFSNIISWEQCNLRKPPLQMFSQIINHCTWNSTRVLTQKRSSSTTNSKLQLFCSSRHRRQPALARPFCHRPHFLEHHFLGAM